jgi:hypothetical protein
MDPELLGFFQREERGPAALFTRVADLFQSSLDHHSRLDYIFSSFREVKERI